MTGDLAGRLRSRSGAVADDAVEEALASGFDGETELGMLLDELSGFRRIMLVFSLGELMQPGPADAALRRCLAAEGPGTRDLRCATLVALAKRLGSAATPDFLVGLEQKDPEVRSYALTCLDVYGTEQAWDPVLRWLKRLRSARPSPRQFDPVEALPASHHALSYLLRTLHEARNPDLVSVIRHRWNHLTSQDQERLQSVVWPGVAPGGPTDPGPPLTRVLADRNWGTRALFA